MFVSLIVSLIISLINSIEKKFSMCICKNIGFIHCKLICIYSILNVFYNNYHSKVYKRFENFEINIEE